MIYNSENKIDLTTTGYGICIFIRIGILSTQAKNKNHLDQ